MSLIVLHTFPPQGRLARTQERGGGAMLLLLARTQERGGGAMLLLLARKQEGGEGAMLLLLSPPSRLRRKAARVLDLALPLVRALQARLGVGHVGVALQLGHHGEGSCHGLADRAVDVEVRQLADHRRNLEVREVVPHAGVPADAADRRDREHDVQPELLRRVEPRVPRAWRWG